MSSDAELIGQRLREAREARDMTLDEAERATRIRARFLEALEVGDYSSMTPVQAQGFLRNYARFLQLDIELLMSELDEEGSRGRRHRRAALPTPSGARMMPAEPATQSAAPRGVAPRTGRARRRRGILSTLLIVLISGGIVVAVVLGATTLLDQWARSETSPGSAPLQTPTSPLAGDELMGDGMTDGTMTDDSSLASGNESPVPAPSATGAESAPATAIYTPPTLTGSNIVLVIEVVQYTYVRITSDGLVTYDDWAEAGEILNYTAQSNINVYANNAAGLQLTVNNQPQGTLGPRGTEFNQTYTLEGAVSPTSAQPPNGDTAAVPASPTEAALFFTPTPTLPLDPGDGSVFDPLAPFSLTPRATETPAVTATSALTATPTLTPPSSDTPVPTPTATLAATPTPAATYTLTPTPSGTYTVQPTATPSHTPTATDTATNTPTATATSTPSATPTATPTATRTPTLTFTWTPSPTWSVTPSYTPTYTLTPTATPFLPPRLTRTPTPPLK